MRLVHWIVQDNLSNEYLTAANEMQWFGSQRSAEMGWDRQHSHNPTVCYLTEQRYSVFTAVAGGMFYHPPLSSTGGKLRATEHQSWHGYRVKKFKQENIACSSLHKLHYIMILSRCDLRKWKRKDTKEWISAEGVWNHFLPDVNGISASGDKALTRMRWTML